MLKRIIAVSLIVSLLLSFGVQASAASTLEDKVYDIAVDIWEWLDTPLFEVDEPHGGGRDSSPFSGGGRYDDYVDDIQNDVGTVSITNNGIRLYMIPDGTFAGSNGVFSSYSVPFTIGYYTISTFTYTPITSFIGYCSTLSGQVQVGYQAVTIPFQASYTYHLVTDTDNCVFAPTTSKASTFNAAAGATIDYIGKITASSAGAFSANVAIYYDIVPYTGVVSDYYSNVDITVNNRMTSIIQQIDIYNTTNTDNQYYLGVVENNTVTNVYNTNIFDETTNVFTLPGETPTTYNITDWTYDYSTRTYVCVDSDNNTYIVQYGDTAVYVTVPDGSGGTSTTTYQYVIEEPEPDPGSTTDTSIFPNPSGDTYEDDPNTTGGFFSTIWKAIKDGVADLIAGIIKGLFKGLEAVISGIMDLFSGIVTGFFDNVTGFFDLFNLDGIFHFYGGEVNLDG